VFKGVEKVLLVSFIYISETRTKIIWSGSNILDRTNKQVFITLFLFLNQIQNVFGLGPTFFDLVQSIIKETKICFMTEICHAKKSLEHLKNITNTYKVSTFTERKIFDKFYQC